MLLYYIWQDDILFSIVSGFWGFGVLGFWGFGVLRTPLILMPATAITSSSTLMDGRDRLIRGTTASTLSTTVTAWTGTDETGTRIGALSLPRGLSEGNHRRRMAREGEEGPWAKKREPRSITLTGRWREGVCNGGGGAIRPILPHRPLPRTPPPITLDPARPASPSPLPASPSPSLPPTAPACALRPLHSYAYIAILPPSNRPTHIPAPARPHPSLKIPPEVGRQIFPHP
jgi:hypothetical protein